MELEEVDEDSTEGSHTVERRGLEFGEAGVTGGQWWW